jgi:hypothetical protein
VTCRGRGQRQFVEYVEQVRRCLGCAAFGGQLVEGAGPQRDDPRDRMTVLGYLYYLTCDDAFQHPAGLLPQFSYAYSVIHGAYTVAHLCRHVALPPGGDRSQIDRCLRVEVSCRSR